MADIAGINSLIRKENKENNKNTLESDDLISSHSRNRNSTPKNNEYDPNTADTITSNKGYGLFSIVSNVLSP